MVTVILENNKVCFSCSYNAQQNYKCMATVELRLRREKSLLQMGRMKNSRECFAATRPYFEETQTFSQSRESIVPCFEQWLKLGHINCYGTRYFSTAEVAEKNSSLYSARLLQVHTNVWLWMEVDIVFDVHL